MRVLRRLVDRIVLRDKQFRFLFREQETDEAVSLDCETTGFDPWIDEIVSVAAIPICGSHIRTSKSYSALLRPEATMNRRSIRVHQLREKESLKAAGRCRMFYLNSCALLAAGH